MQNNLDINASQFNDESKACLVYDGECPFCSEYVQLLKLRESLGHFELINARDKHPVVDEVIQAGFDLNEGMALKLGGQIYHGADCIHILALLTSSKGFFNKINALIFRSRLLSRILYPVLRSGRNVSLRLLGRDKI